MTGLATSQDYPTLNGMAPSWADIATTIDVVGGGTLRDIDYAGFSFESAVEVGEQRGASGGRVMRRTVGAKTDTASATYYRSGLRRLVEALIPLAPTRGNQRLVSLAPFSVLIQHSWAGDPDIYEVRLKGCRLLKIAESFAEGNEAEKVELDIHPIEIAWLINGVEVVLL